MATAPFLAFSSRAPPPTAFISLPFAAFDNKTFGEFGGSPTWCVKICDMVRVSKEWFPQGYRDGTIVTYNFRAIFTAAGFNISVKIAKLVKIELTITEGGSIAE